MMSLVLRYTRFVAELRFALQLPRFLVLLGGSVVKAMVMLGDPNTVLVWCLTLATSTSMVLLQLLGLYTVHLLQVNCFV